MALLLEWLLAALLGLQATLAVVLLPLIAQSGGQWVEMHLRLLLPRLLVFGLLLSASAFVSLLWLERRPGLLLSCIAFVGLGHALAHHTLRIKSTLSRANQQPASVLKPLQLLNTAQLAVCSVAVLVN